MPRFAALFSLLVMAAVGLPPFALFSAHMQMLLLPLGTISWGLAVILLTWFLASWYLFRMMQRLLFGRHRDDMHYTDLRAGEFTWFAILLVILAVLGATQPAWLRNSFIHRLSPNRHGDKAVAQVATRRYQRKPADATENADPSCQREHRLLLADAYIRASQPAAWLRTFAF